jgi:hypothetical protein
MSLTARLPRTGAAAARWRWLALGSTLAGAGLLPWMVYLAASLPASPRASHWPAAWVGLDAMEAAGLLATGLLLLRRDVRSCLTALATAGLLAADAWFDVTTAPPGSGQLAALVMALCAELPGAACCAAIGVAGLRRLLARPLLTPTDEAPVPRVRCRHEPVSPPVQPVGSGPCEYSSSGRAAASTP